MYWDIYIYTARTCINILFRIFFNVLLPSKVRATQRGSWFSNLQLRRRCIQKYPKFLEKKPSKSMQINETVRCCQDQLTPPKCWGKRQTRRTFFFPATRYMMSVRTKSFSPESTWIKLQVPGILPSISKNPKNFCLGKVFKNLYTTYMAFRNQGQKCLSLWQKRKIFNHGHGSKIRCMFSVWIQIIHSKDPEIKLVAISRVASEPSWSGLGWPAGTDCTSTFSNSSKHTPCVNMDISSILVYIV